MPRARSTQVAPTLPVRQSPRKRKREENVVTGDVVSTVEEPVPTSPRKTTIKATQTKARPVKPVKEVKSEDITESKSSNEAARLENPDDEIAPPITAPKRNSRKKPQPAEIKAKVEEIDIKDQKDESAAVLKKKTKVVHVQQDDDDSAEERTKKVSRKRKTKEEKEAEAMPLAARSTGLKMFVGAHVSIAKGVENAITNCAHIGGNAFALFLKSQRKWDNPALKDENRDAFRQSCSHHNYDAGSHVVPHGSYLVNLASANPDMAKKSYDTFVDDLHRCEALGIKYYNFHPGATNQEPLPEAIGRLAAKLNKALSATKTVVPLLENMTGSGTIIGSRFTDLRDVIALIEPKHKSRIGICIDTCHTFAAGYDLRSPEAYQKTLQELDDTVGLKYLKALHMNDSKAPLGSKRDLHQNIGAGFLGLRAFHNIMNDSRLQDLPLILETPCDRPDPSDATGKKTIDDKNVWAREIKLLESLIGMDVDNKEFQRLEAELSESGKAERDKMQLSITTRDEKARKKVEKERAKGQKSIGDMLGAKGKKKRKGGAHSDSSDISDASE